MDSIWQKDGALPQFAPLRGENRTDVLVIGGGMAGLLCAHSLRRAGVDCMLIEENRIMSGVSGRTTAKLTSQHGLLYSRLLKQWGPERASRYWQANQRAVAAMSALAQQAQCDFSRKPHYIFQTDGTDKLEKEAESYEALNIPYRWAQPAQLPLTVSGAIGFDRQGQFHPLKLAAYLAKDLPIYENTKALAWLGDRVQIPGGSIRAERIIVATHFPPWNKHGAYFLKLYQQRSYVLALENGPQLEGMYLNCAENGLSLRNAGEHLLLGGGGHRTGKPGLGWRLPERAAAQYFPGTRVTARWATQDCMSLDGVPYIGPYSPATPGVYVATGFGKWGMSTSMVAAQLLTDLVLGRENACASLFSPKRSIWHRQLAVNAAQTTANLLRLQKPRCPHLGCALHWNSTEHSWDCACHGSRFDAQGKRLNGPASEDLK